MASEMAEAISQLINEKGISEDLIVKTIEDALMAAYKKKYGTNENAVVRFKDNYEGIDIYAKKTIVEEVDDPVLEISLEEAQEMADGAEVGDILELPVDPHEFDLQSVMLAKQTTRQSLREISRDTQYAEYKSKVGEIIIGYYQREKNGNIFVDLGKIEGLFPKKYQSPRETYHPNDRIKAMIVEVEKGRMGPLIILSRTHAEFVRKILELEVPEIYDKAVDVFKIVREPGSAPRSPCTPTARTSTLLGPVWASRAYASRRSSASSRARRSISSSTRSTPSASSETRSRPPRSRTSTSSTRPSIWPSP